VFFLNEKDIFLVSSTKYAFKKDSHHQLYKPFELAKKGFMHASYSSQYPYPSESFSTSLKILSFNMIFRCAFAAAYPGLYGHYFPSAHHGLGNSAVAAAAASLLGSGGASGGMISGLLGAGPTPKRKRRHR
jgi:hypothetical protein